jgi:hypothetical protein
MRLLCTAAILLALTTTAIAAPSEREIQAGVAAARAYVDSTGYGSFISNDVLRAVVVYVLRAAERARTK